MIKAGEEVDLDALPVAPVISSIPAPQPEEDGDKDEADVAAAES